MKNLSKIIAVSISGLVVAGVAFAWNNPSGAPPTGSGAISVSSSGNVGVGTVVPTNKLHISGKLRVEDGTQGLNKVLSSDANGIASWVALAKGATVDHFDIYGINDDVKTCTDIFKSLNSKSGLGSGASKTAVGGHSSVYMATDGRWLFEVTYGDCSPEDNGPGGFGLIPRTSTGAAIPGYWSYKGSL